MTKAGKHSRKIKTSTRSLSKICRLKVLRLRRKYDRSRKEKRSFRRKSATYRKKKIKLSVKSLNK